MRAYAVGQIPPRHSPLPFVIRCSLIRVNGSPFTCWLSGPTPSHRALLSARFPVSVLSLPLPSLSAEFVVISSLSLFLDLSVLHLISVLEKKEGTGTGIYLSPCCFLTLAISSRRGRSIGQRPVTALSILAQTFVF